MKYSIGICDGDSLFCSKLEKYIMDFLKDTKEHADIFVWNTGLACLNDLKNINLDILFLDIDLPDKNGIDFCEHIRNIYRYYDMHIVFVSDKKNLSLELEHLSDNFIRIGQSYIVNINKVKEYHSNFVYMINGKRINISRPYRIPFRIRWDEAER